MRTSRSLLAPRPVVLACAALALTASCSNRPTYPKAQLVSSVSDLLAKEQLRASVRFIEHTLAVHLDYPNALTQVGGQLGIGPAFDAAAGKVLTVIHRVLLSTNAQVNFYVLLLSDPNTPGAYLTLVRYLDDVRRVNANMLNTPEMFARTIFELNYLPESSTPLTIDQYVPRDIRLEEFLSWQLARRIQQALTEELQKASTAEVGRCGGEFRDGEFAFTLNVAPAEGQTLDDATIRNIFRTSTNVIAKVLGSYRFESFNAIRLVHQPTGRSLVLPKTRLEVFR